MDVRDSKEALSPSNGGLGWGWGLHPLSACVTRYVLPLILLAAFLFKLATDIAAGQPGNSLWICHVSNLLLSIALIANLPRLAQASILWILCGLPLWVLDMLYTEQVSIASVLAHLAGLTVSLFALRIVGMGHRAWLSALVLFLLVQQLSRYLTAPALNVNLAHQIYDGAARWFTHYPAYWALNTLLAAALLFTVARTLARWFPAPGARHAQP